MIILTLAEQRIITALRDQPAATNAEIAAALGKSKRTVDNQFRALYRKLGIEGDNRRVQLIEWIRQNE